MVSPPAPGWLSFLLAAIVFACLFVIARKARGWTRAPTVPVAVLRSRWMPLVAGLLTALIVRLVWGSFDEPGVVHDERAYLLQAAIFARGHWTAATPPLPSFFEQMHVFVEPAVFAKYPPGHALLLAPGVWLGLPGLMPALLTGVSGALIFWIARRLANEWVALFTWWLWTTAWANLYWSASYFSESTSTALFWLAVFATIRWLDTRRTIFLAAVPAAIAFGIETRPLTMAVLAVPLAVPIASQLRSLESAGRTLAAPVVVAALVLLLGPLWNQETLGDWRLSPYSYYSKVYFPFDKPGFGVDPSPPLRNSPPELVAVGDWSRDVHQDYVPSSLPSALVKRLLSILFWCVDGWRLVLGALILAAVRHGSRLERYGLASIAVLLLAYLSFAHPPMWIVYYVEVLPILYFLAACQIGRLLHAFSGVARPDGARWSLPVTRAAAATALLLVPLGVSDVVRVRRAVDLRNQFHRSARAAIEAHTPSRAIVFVHYPAGYNPHLGLTGSVADLDSDRWVVFDRGSRNEELTSMAPGVPAFRLDAGTFHLERLDDGRPAVATINGVVSASH